jgi:TolB-like protein/DNA-binding SARP family transcriptional activator/Flp pilus assembly protein TadD
VPNSLRPPFRLITLGRLALVDATGREEPTLASRRRKLAVLAVIALAPRPLSRDTLIDMFWGERDEARARNSLSDALSHLRSVLGRAALPAYRDEIRLAEDSSLTTDVVDLAGAAAAGDHARVAALYGGSFLEGVHVDEAPRFEDWRDRIRMQADAAFVKAAAAICAQLAGAQHHEERALLARRWLALEPGSTVAALHLLDAISAPGTREARIAAAREYQALVERLRRDLDIAPDTAVVERAAELATGLAGAAKDVPGDPTDEAAAVPPAPPASSPPRSPGSGSRRTALLAAAALTVLAVASALLVLRSGTDPAPTRVATTDDIGHIVPGSVAVLRFRNISGDSADQYFSDGMAEEVMHALARVEGLQVAARSASFLLPADSLDPREVGRRLRVATVLEGNVRRAGDLLRVSVRLVSTTNGYTLWQDSYDRRVTDAFRVQEEVARSVAGALRIEFQRADALRARRAIADFETYDLYLRGRYIWWTTSTEEGVQRSIAHFRRALARDSTFAQAWVGLADALLELTSSHHVTPVTVVTPARDALLRAIALDPYLADAHASLGYLATFHDHQWQSAESSFLRALALDARHANARLWLAWLLTARGRHDEAAAQIRQAQAYEPLSRLLGARLATMLYFARNYEGCIRQANISIEADSTFWLPYRQLGEALVQVGRPADALAPMRKAVALSPTAENRARHAYALARAGDTAAARDILADLASEGGNVSPVEVARVYTALGENDRALHFLERGAELGSSALVLVGVEPAFDPLRGSPRFQRIVRRLDL